MNGLNDMAYLSTEQAKTFRKLIKAALPEYKLSIVNKHWSSLNVSIVEGKHDFESGCRSLNPFRDNYEDVEINRILKIIKWIVFNDKYGYYDRSDAMTDYFDTAWYLNVSIGKWDKHYQLT